MEKTVTISIASAFSRVPAGRFRTDGPYSGERFRDDFLLPPLIDGQQVIVDFDGARGYGSSFLEEAFGGLVRKNVVSPDVINTRIKFVSTEDPSVEAEVREYIAKAISRQE